MWTKINCNLLFNIAYLSLKLIYHTCHWFSLPPIYHVTFCKWQPVITSIYLFLLYHQNYDCPMLAATTDDDDAGDDGDDGGDGEEVVNC